MFFTIPFQNAFLRGLKNVTVIYPNKTGHCKWQNDLKNCIWVTYIFFPTFTGKTPGPTSTTKQPSLLENSVIISVQNYACWYFIENAYLDTYTYFLMQERNQVQFLQPNHLVFQVTAWSKVNYSNGMLILKNVIFFQIKEIYQIDWYEIRFFL